MAGAAAIVDLVYGKKIQCFRLAISGIVPAVQGRLIAVQACTGLPQQACDHIPCQTLAVLQLG